MRQSASGEGQTQGFAEAGDEQTGGPDLDHEEVLNRGQAPDHIMAGGDDLEKLHV